MDEEKIKNVVNKMIDERIKKQLQSNLFSSRKLTDTPTDDLMLVNRRYTNLNGTIATRPASVAAIVGQSYYATDIAMPVVYDGTNWRNGVGSIVAIN